MIPEDAEQQGNGRSRDRVTGPSRSTRPRRGSSCPSQEAIWVATTAAGEEEVEEEESIPTRDRQRRGAIHPAGRLAELPMDGGLVVGHLIRRNMDWRCSVFAAGRRAFWWCCCLFLTAGKLSAIPLS